MSFLPKRSVRPRRTRTRSALFSLYGNSHPCHLHNLLLYPNIEDVPRLLGHDRRYDKVHNSELLASRRGNVPGLISRANYTFGSTVVALPQSSAFMRSLVYG